MFYPPWYKSHIWHYKHKNVDMISKVVEWFDWDKKFSDKSADENAPILIKN